MATLKVFELLIFFTTNKLAKIDENDGNKATRKQEK